MAQPAGWALLAVIVVIAIYSASITKAGPWDPWETHYGEVARNINARHDPLELWWQGGNSGPEGDEERRFASKPALPFWCMAVSMKVLGVGASPDPSEMVRSPWPELAIRLPSMIAGLLSAFFLGAVAWRLVSPRAGIVTGIVISTMPQWAMVTRQALTDMYFVGPVVLAGGAWALAWMQRDRVLQTRGRGWRELPVDRAYVAFLVVFALAAIVPLAVLHQHVYDPQTWAQHGRTRGQGLHDVQIHLFAYWIIAAIVFVRSLRWRWRSQAWMGILYMAGGLSLLGKGLIGPGITGAMILAHLAVSGRWKLLLKCGLPIGILLFALVGFPWHHAMMLFAGDRWTSELIIENNLARFTTGEQAHAIGGFAYYLETLGLAALPWIAVVPMAIWGGIVAFKRRSLAEDEHREEADHGAAALHRFATLWFMVSLIAISYSTTKYYHYLLPCLPPLALLVGLWIDRMLDARAQRSPALLVAGLLGVALLVAVVRDALYTPSWIAHLTTYLYTGMWTKGGPDPERLVITCVPFAAGLLVWGLAATRRARRFAAGAWLLSGLLTTAYVIGDYMPAASENWSQRSALRIYYDERGPNDRIVSWWFYYRGETFFTKADIWVMKNADRGKLGDLFAEMEGTGAALWFITIEPHAKRLRSHVPSEYRDAIEVKYESFHYVLMRVPLK